MGGGWLAALGGYLFHYYNTKTSKEREARLERSSEQLRGFWGPLLACVTATKSSYDAMLTALDSAGLLAATTTTQQDREEGRQQEEGLPLEQQRAATAAAGAVTATGQTAGAGGGRMADAVPSITCSEAAATRGSSSISSSSSSSSSSTDSLRAALRQELAANPQGRAAQVYRTWVTTVFQPLNEKAAAVVTQRIDLLESGGGCVEPCLLQLVAHVSAYRVLLERWRLGDVSATSAISYPDTLLGYVQATFASIKRRQAELLGMTKGGGSGKQQLAAEPAAAGSALDARHHVSSALRVQSRL